MSNPLEGFNGSEVSIEREREREREREGLELREVTLWISKLLADKYRLIP